MPIVNPGIKDCFNLDRAKNFLISSKRRFFMTHKSINGNRKQTTKKNTKKVEGTLLSTTREMKMLSGARKTMIEGKMIDEKLFFMLITSCELWKNG